jgi:hypothetical protein
MKTVIYNAQLMDHPSGRIVLRGYLDLSTIDSLLADTYQREVLSGKKVNNLREALKAGAELPEIELGLRGGHYSDENDIFTLTDDVYIIDGLQRISAVRALLTEDADKFTEMIALSVVVYFDTDKAWEMARFQILNLSQSKLSANVTLRNQADTSPAIAALLRLTSEKTFILGGKVCWTHNMIRGQIMSAGTLVSIVGVLHSHAGPGLSTAALARVAGLDKIQDNVGRANFYFNVKEFFSALDSAYGLNRVAYRDTASYIKLTFMKSLAMVFSDHREFWINDKLTISPSVLKRLQSFPVDDPTVVTLAGSSGQSERLLSIMSSSPKIKHPVRSYFCSLRVAA